VAFSFGLGLISAMDTFCTQAYGAGTLLLALHSSSSCYIIHRLLKERDAENYALVGVYLQRAVLIASVYCLLIGAVLFNTRELLVLTGQDPAIAAMAAQYVRCASSPPHSEIKKSPGNIRGISWV
jgi:Na+-driven multidrug efflux pump